MFRNKLSLFTSKHSFNFFPKFLFSLTRHQKIEEILDKEFNPEFKEIINESKNHSVPRDSETHFKIIVVSDKFSGRTKIDIHREINSKLKDEFSSGLHALSIVTYTPEEWKKKPKVPESEKCRGGSKHKL